MRAELLDTISHSAFNAARPREDGPIQIPDVRNLPLIERNAIEGLPDTIDARFLDGDWFGRGPEIVLVDRLFGAHVHLPLIEHRDHIGAAIVALVAARPKVMLL